jgi:hypothetical protein
MLFKDMFIKKLRQLPEDILKEVYYLDIAILKGRLQWNSFLVHQYRKQKKQSHNKGWLEFKMGDWIIQMETED